MLAPVTGTLINVATVLAGTTIGTLAGSRLPDGIQQRVLMGLGLVTLVIGIDAALAWNATNPLYVLGGVLLGGIAGEVLGIERRLEALGDSIQARVSRAEGSRVSEGFVTASLLFCVGPLTVLGSIEDGLTDQYTQLATKAVLDGFASIALAAALGWGVGISVVTILVVQGSITLGAGAFDDLLQGETLDVLTSAGGILIIAIALKLLDVKDVKVGNFLPALVLAPGIYGISTLF
jgi:uncharacterized membrane protein YqgA involved in biofilm formation